ncbi:hypothetical protein CHS0354_041893 [Potamilus streckersoni]|uniref:Laccase n=1 Tax=Potamilus streckersoni TaxID=2493646 RepID=A0AAE0SSX4_9BIVA|nr:hypothetical protein CHS0354_041893 [Potamilus streckersoni]
MSQYALLVASTVIACLLNGSHGTVTEKNTYENHTCIRECTLNSSRTCVYDFILEYYFTLTKACYNCPINVTDCYRPHCVAANGYPRAIMTVNRMLPGPAIHVCKGDTIVVNVQNALQGGEGTSIHWHGVLQHDSQYMDGVSMLTQCPIPSHTTFQYKFKANNAGTHFWHAHSGLQRSDGFYGVLVIRDAPEHEVHLGLYDFDLPEHTIVVNDWLIELCVSKFANHHHAGGDNKPESMLINGRGMFQNFSNNSTQSVANTPVAVFKVHQGRRYRFRSISNGILNCPIQVSIDNHNLTMIASDGNPFKKIEVESFNIFAGERFDFVLAATADVGNYWIRARGLADCSVKKAKQVAILRYEGAPDEQPTQPISYEDANRSGKKLNPWNQKGTEELIQITDLDSLVEDDAALKDKPDKKFYIYMDFNKIDNYHFQDKTYYPLSAVEKAKHLYMPQMNRISTILPPTPPLTQYKDIPTGTFCNPETINKNCTKEYCECTFLLKASLGDVVELVVIDEGVTFNANHPVHLHGHAFRVVGMDRLNDSTSVQEVMRLDAEGKLPRKLTKAVSKDTVTIPDGGYSILRFLADNPGFWLFHCHIEFHVEIGMGLIIQVGEPGQMPKPPRNFPKCGHWSFQGYDEDQTNQTETKCNVSSASMNNIGTTVLMIVLGAFWMR